MIVNRIEKHIIKLSNPFYKLLDEFCFKSKNLYNFANYQIRQKFCKDNEYISGEVTSIKCPRSNYV